VRRSPVALGLVVAIVGVVLAFATASPFSTAGSKSRARTTARVPVLLVHGFNGSPSGWGAMIATLERAGWPVASVTAMSYDSTLSNEDIAYQVAQEVARLRARTGATRVDVVSHSMGALSTRWYLEHLGGTSAVDTWVSLGGVNQGTIWAYGCFVLAPCRDMVPTSPMLAELERRFPPAGATRFAAWWSPCDELIVPTDSARLPGARNHETDCIDHTALRSDPTVLGEVVALLRKPVRRGT
jgi:triacylglycerol lipase